jgi:hypothetical protein
MNNRNFLVPLVSMLLLLCSSLGFAKSVYFRFIHNPATTTQPASAPHLCMEVQSSDFFSFHRAGLCCHLSCYIEYDKFIKIGGYYQDHVNKGAGGLFGKYDLYLICARPGYAGEVTREYASFELKDDGKTNINISASCPVDEHGHLLKPSNIKIE